MENVILWLIIGILVAVILGFVGYKVITVFKMGPDEKKELLITYLKGFVALAERQIGSGNGKEKLAQVEAWFEEKAPFIYKLALNFLGKGNLVELIEEALRQIKENFGK